MLFGDILSHKQHIWVGGTSTVLSKGGWVGHQHFCPREGEWDISGCAQGRASEISKVVSKGGQVGHQQFCPKEGRVGNQHLCPKEGLVGKSAVMSKGRLMGHSSFA